MCVVFTGTLQDLSRFAERERERDFLRSRDLFRDLERDLRGRSEKGREREEAEGSPMLGGQPRGQVRHA